MRSLRQARSPARAMRQLARPRSAGDLRNGDFDAVAFLAKAGIGKALADVARGATVFAQGDAADSIFYVRKGKIKLSVVSKRGKEAIVALLGPGEFIGEEAVACNHPTRLATATALLDSTLLKISKKEMARVLGEEHALSDVFVQFLLERNARIQADLVDQLFNSSEKRLARVLLLLAQFGQDAQQPETVIPKLSQETLAEMVGTTRSRISFFMNRFRKMGFIKYNGEIQVHRSLLNVVLHD